MGFFNERNISNARLRHTRDDIFLLLVGLSIAGCSITPTKTIMPEPEIVTAVPEPWAKAQCEIQLETLVTEKEAQHQEIERLQKVLAEKEAQIRTQQARQQDQAKTLQEASNLAAQAQVVTVCLECLLDPALLQQQCSQRMPHRLHPRPRLVVGKVVVELDRAT